MLEIFTLSDGKRRNEPCAFLLGGFDGLHVGHEKLVKKALEFGIPVGIMTINGGKDGGNLFTVSEREEIFSSIGISFLLETDFSPELRNMSAEDFISLLIKKFNVAVFVCGKDFRFGKGALGSPCFIKDRFGVEVCDEDISLDKNGEKIGAREIKRAIEEGDVSGANALLASPFSVSGKVVHGRCVGRKMGFPTANILYPPDKVRLKEGVYSVRAILDSKEYSGIANFGGCPTFGVEGEKLEVFFDGYSGDLYGRELRVFFDRRIRDIKKFSSENELKEQLAKDISAARREENR